MMGSAVQQLWEWIYDDFGRSDFNLTVIGSSAVIFIVFWVVSGLFMIVDLTGKPRWMLGYKVQRDKNVPVDKEKLWGAIKVALFNQLGLSVPLAVISWPLQNMYGQANSCQPDDIPTFWRVIGDLLGCTIINEIGFYYSHRLVHYGPLYKHIHKKHHEWTSPIGVVALYAHPVEFVVANILPVTIGPIILRSHMFTTWIWYILAITVTVVHHSGYHLPFLPSPQFHDFHHVKFNVNYGVIGFLDWFHGTDQLYRKSVEFKRDKAIFGLQPVWKRYPKPSKTTEENNSKKVK